MVHSLSCRFLLELRDFIVDDDEIGLVFATLESVETEVENNCFVEYYLITQITDGLFLFIM